MILYYFSKQFQRGMSVCDCLWSGEKIKQSRDTERGEERGEEHAGERSMRGVSVRWHDL